MESLKPLDAEITKTIPQAYTVKVSGLGLDRHDIASKSGKKFWREKLFLYIILLDPFFEVKATFTGYKEPLTMYRSEVVKDNQSPNWKEFTINVADFGGIDKNFTINFYDYDNDGNYLLIFYL